MAEQARFTEPIWRILGGRVLHRRILCGGYLTGTALCGVTKPSYSWEMDVLANGPFRKPKCRECLRRAAGEEQANG